MSILLVGIVVAIVLAAITFISTNNIIVSAVAFGLSIIYFIVFAGPIFGKFLLKKKRFRQCYNFVNTFIISLNIKGSIKSAMESTIGAMGDEFNKDIAGIQNFREEEKLDYLRKYFKFHFYGLFVDLINLWTDEGGNILSMSSYLIEQSRELEEYISTTDSACKRKVVEFVTLWGFSLAILVFLKYALSTFYDFILKQAWYPYAMLCVIILVLFSIHITVTKMTKLDIRGWESGK